MNRLGPRLVPVAFSFLAACGGRTDTTPGGSAEFQDRPTIGEACLATYAPREGVTVVGRVVGDLGIAMVGLPGDGWTVDCSSAQQALVTATNEATEREMTMVVDEETVGTFDLATYANAHVALMRRNYVENGLDDLESSDPILADGGYVVVTRATGAHAPFFQLSAFQVIGTPLGAIRMHLSEASTSPATLDAHTEMVVGIASTFRLEAPEE